MENKLLKEKSTIIKIASLIVCAFTTLSMVACGGNSVNFDKQLQTVPEIDFDYNIIKTEYNVSDITAPMMYFNCEFILPNKFEYAPESEDVLRLMNEDSISVQQSNILGKQMVNFIDIHYNSKSDSLSKETLIKEIFEKNTDSVKKYCMNYNNSTIDNANNFYSEEKYQILNQDVDITYYKSDNNQKIAALSVELIVKETSKDELIEIYTIYYYREDLPNTYVAVGTNEKIDPAQHYGIHIINLLKITGKFEFCE
jgi:hypothetical protein